MSRVHVVGAGLAGLACGVELVKRGRTVTLYDAANHAGGRARSYFDKTLDRLIDNGNHLMLGANTAVFSYLADVNAGDGLAEQAQAAFPFVDLGTGERWTLRPNAGRLPWWIFNARRRVPGSRWTDYLAALRLRNAPGSATVDAVLGAGGPLRNRLWKPLTDAVLNTAPHEAAASLLWPVVIETFGRGERACRAYIAKDGLSPNLVDPGVRFIEAGGGALHLSSRLRTIVFEGSRTARLDFTTQSVELGPGDAVILAVPPLVAGQLLPDLVVPEASRAIVNAHYRLDAPVALPGGQRLLGLVGGTAHWLFARGDVISVTVSAAEDLVDADAKDIADLIWADVGRALDRKSAPVPPSQIVKEKRATFAQTPENVRRRPGARIGFGNFFLAGDWTDTGLPATLESAIRSGRRAAECALSAA